MDSGSGDVNENLRDNSFHVSGIQLDDSLQSNGPSVGYGDGIHEKSSFPCLNRSQTEYMQSHPYIQSSRNDGDSSHYFHNFDGLSQSSSRKHSLSGVVRTRRRKAGISEEERVCIVCGEAASGYNFDRLTCESCKAFFRRNALKPRDKIKACNRGGGCAIEGNQRKHCPSCRLEKCLAVGMKRELILPPEKLEQRAKPRRRKHHSPQDSSSPQNHPTGPSSVGSSNTNAYPPYLSSLTTSSHLQHRPNQISHNSCVSGASRSLHLTNPIKFSSYVNTSRCNELSLTTDTFNSSGTLENKECNLPTSSLKNPLVGKSDELFMPPINQDESLNEKILPLESTQRSDHYCKIRPRLCPTQCRKTGGLTFCQHRSCRLRSDRKRRLRRRFALSGSKCLRSHLLHISSPDPHLLSCLQGCIRRIREPFTPDEQLETGIAVTLEQEYNRMDACIRRIIRVVKLLPYFSEVGKPAQLSLLRTNIYGLIVLYSSFFFERDIRKLRYPVLQTDGQLTTVTVSMLDEVATPSTSVNESDDVTSESCSKLLQSNNFRSLSRCRSNQANYAAGLREEFELYKSNTLAAFDHLDELVGSDDILRMSVLAIKLFSDNSLAEDLRAPVFAARQAYTLFLWNYIRWQAGSKRLRSATELYARILIAFIDLRTLEIRMTEFAKLLSLDGLSPLMREVCSQRNNLGSTSA
ncbi:hypothetical protein MN116_001143 [Schistosoma mekongi]|uniref:Nuclear receptor domain-containing protein n=1 Tax=Schistosoma mekongi TaxID=38744 RepID=A0AAE2D8Y0_SCHME|nr:hypothetical protein MN116_001143 [Schistosoma mekongi]